MDARLGGDQIPEDGPAPVHHQPVLKGTDKGNGNRAYEERRIIQQLKENGALRLSEAKQKILMILLEQPGLSIKDVAEALEVTHTTAGRHLRGLCNKGLVMREKEGSMERHYVIPSKEPRALSWLRVTVQNIQTYSIVEYLVTNHSEETTVNRIANEVNVYHGLLLRTLRNLERHKFVEMVRPGGWYYVKVTPLLREYWGQIHQHD